MENKLLRLNKKKLIPFKTSSKIKNAIKEWYKKYQLGELEEEVRNYLNFENIILKNLLDYKQNDFEFEYPLNGRSVEFMILKDNKPYIAIELKGTKTKDLTRKYGEDKYSAVEQASNYASKKSSIEWYIVSNYYEFRLYNKKSQNNYISFNLDDLKPNEYDYDEERIRQFLNVFSRVAILEKNQLNKLYDSKGLFPEDFNLENEFYKLYNETRLMIIKELEENNQLKRESSIEYAQLILNRYIFTCFSEDKGLLPDNLTTDEILTPIRRKVLSISTIWSRLNELFYFINNGNPDNNITGYNGGLFKEDLGYLRIRDKIEDTNFYDDIKVKWSFPEQEHIIDHELRNYPNINQIYRNLLIISSFDFQTDLTENILGHIFENSISDLEELKNETINKRKKEGVYYTPEYITKYICENTIIPYLSKKNNNTIESLIKEYSNNLKELETKLHDIKILDPACGSGAFLNKATDILLNIHKAIFKLKHENNNNLDKEFDNIDNRREILLNNIYGVDLNHESIEITKLGLFLKVCKKGIKLPDLDKNIKCGNSLIDNLEYTDNPFQWKNEFSKVFKEGGFDVIVGNPPYVDIKQLDDKTVKYIFENYETSSNRINLYSSFVEKGLNIMKKEGYFSFIIPNSILFNSSYEKIRHKILKLTYITDIVKLNDNIFLDAKVEPIILVSKKTQKNENTHIKIFFDEKNVIEHNINQEQWLNTSKNIINIYASPKILNLMEKIEHSKKLLKDICDFSLGITPYDKYKGMNKEDIENRIFHSKTQKTDSYKKLLRGGDVTRYNVTWNKIEYINYGNWLAAPREDRFFTKPRILVRQILSGTPKKIFATYTEEELYNTQSIFNILLKDESISLLYILSILNSKLMNWYHIEKFLDKNKKLFPKILIENTKNFPIPSKKKENIFENLALSMIDKNEKLHNEVESFHKYLFSDFNVSKINKKLMEYYNLTFDDLYKEVKKQYKQITRQEKDKLEKEYILSIEIIEPLQKEIKSIDKEIDNLVYELYDLNDEEIKIIEKSV